MAPAAELTIRCFSWRRDGAGVEELERRCEAAPGMASFLRIDTTGDPLCRIHNSPSHNMLVAYLEGELVGVVRGSIKNVTTGSAPEAHAKVGYILGLRVSPLHRRRGVGLRLVLKMEEWFVANLVDYAYMATESGNRASVQLFTDKLGYIKFRTPSILVNPVRRRAIRLPSSVKITMLGVEQAERLYRRFLGATEFFPRDIDQVLRNRLSLGTWIAYLRESDSTGGELNVDLDMATLPSWAMLSVWNCNQVFKLQVQKPKAACFLYGKASSFSNKFFPCLGVPALPDLSRPFGFYFMYGIHGEGPNSAPLVRSLCKYVHNMAGKREDCKVVVAEVGGCDVIRLHIPHWRLPSSCSQDLWCIKELRSKDEAAGVDCTKWPPTQALFVDPREV